VTTTLHHNTPTPIPHDSVINASVGHVLFFRR
jgi:hypothetical protein